MNPEPGGSPGSVAERNRPRRRFTLADGMILVVGVAVGLALVRFEATQRSTGIQAIMLYGSGLGIGLSLAHLAIRLRPPRPRWRLLTRQIGTSAAMLVPVMLIFQTSMIAATAYVKFRARPHLLPLDDLIAMIGLAVLAAWVVLIPSRPAGRRGDWVEWAGRILGSCWISLLLIYLLVVSYADLTAGNLNHSSSDQT